MTQPRWIVLAAVAAAVVTLGVAALLTTIIERKQEARNPFWCSCRMIRSITTRCTPGSMDEGGGTRTHDLGIKSPLLYQLSYAPRCGKRCGYVS